MSKSILSTILSALALAALTGKFPRDDEIEARLRVGFGEGAGGVLFTVFSAGRG